MPVGFGEARGLLHQHMRAFNRDGLHARFVEVEDNVPPRGADGIIQMHDRTRCARHAFERFLNKVAPRLCQALDRHIIGDASAIDQTTDKIEICRTGAWETNFDFLHAHFQEKIKKPALFLCAHRVDQRLIAIAQVGRKPTWRSVYCTIWPLTIGQINLRECAVFTRWIG